MQTAIERMLKTPESIRNLSWVEISSTILIVFLIIQLCIFTYNVYVHPLSIYPGPFLARGSSIPKLIQVITGNDVHWIHLLHERYGPVVRLSPSELSYTSAQAWRDIQTVQRGSTGGPIPVDPIYGQHEKDMFGAHSLLWIVNPAEHARHRNAMLPAFSARSLRDQEPILDWYTRLFLRRMRENAGQTIDLAAWFNFATFDIIGDLTYGESFGCLEKSRFHPWIHFIFTRIRFMLLGQIISNLGLVGQLAKIMIPKRIKDDIAWHIAITVEKVNRRRRKESADRQDFMTHILPKVHEDKTPPDSGLSLAELYANSQTLVMAGSETTATLLAATAYYLMKNPSKLSKLRAELRDAFGSESHVDFAAVSNTANFPYLAAVLSEALRMQAPIPTSIPKRVGPSGATIDGRFVSPGTGIVVAHWATYRSSRNFRDADRFVPERWLGDERYKDDKQEAFQPFSIGPRSCVGRHLAVLETRRMIAALVWNFEFELMPESEDWDVQKVFLIYEKKPLYTRLSFIGKED